jgi:hypothetical protein
VINPTLKWHTAQYLPTPGIPLWLKTLDGVVIKGIRPDYVASRSQDDLGYVDESGATVVCEWWAYQ